MSHTSKRYGPAVAAALLAIGCSERATAPRPVTLANPEATAASLAAVDSVLRVPVARSFTTFAGAFSAPAGLAPAALAGSGLPALPRPGESAQATSARRAWRLTRLAPELGASLTSFTIIPDSLRGFVFRWDSASASYQRAATSGGPTNGVRFILYAVDTAGQIAYPLAEVGYADLLDESTESGPQLHILVRSPDGAITYVDHTVAITPIANGFTAVARGFVSNGRMGPDYRTLRFATTLQASATESGATAALDAQLGLSEPAVTIQITERHTFTGNGGAAAVDFRINHDSETLQLEGTFVVSAVTADSAVVTVNAAILVNGQILATVQGTPPDHLTFRDGAGNPVPPGPVLEALGQLSTALDGVSHLVQGLFSPIANIFGGF